MFISIRTKGWATKMNGLNLPIHIHKLRQPGIRSLIIAPEIAIIMMQRTEICQLVGLNMAGINSIMAIIVAITNNLLEICLALAKNIPNAKGSIQPVKFARIHAMAL